MNQPPAAASRRTTPATVAADDAVSPWPARIVWGLSGLNLATVIAVLLLVFLVSEGWWISTAITYLPRVPWAVPSVVLLAAAVLWHRPSAWINLLALGLVLGPLMELRIPGVMAAPSAALPPTQGVSLRVVSANVQSYKPNFAEVLGEVMAFQPDLVAFQEARGEHKFLAETFVDWHVLHVEYVWIGSRYPLKLVTPLTAEAFDRTVGILVEVQTPGGPILVADVHLMTARKGLKAINKGSVLNGEAAEEIGNFQDLRLAEMHEVRQQIDARVNEQPLLVMGDFNTPTSSSFFTTVWGDLQSAFDVAGWGYGYSSPVKTHNYWPDHTPWARIDHILCSTDWTIRRCHVGKSCGSDHHLIAAELAR